MARTLVRTAALSSTLAVLLASAAAAQRVERFDGAAGVKEVDADNSVEMNGVSVTARGRIGGDLELNSAAADGNAEVGGDRRRRRGRAVPPRRHCRSRAGGRVRFRRRDLRPRAPRHR